MVSVPISLARSDEGGLDCALADPVEHFRCAFREPETRVVPLASKDTLYPVTTADGGQYLVGGIFDEPRVRTHLVRAISDRRFTALCRLRLIRKVTSSRTRAGGLEWKPAEEPVWAAEVLSCSID